MVLRGSLESLPATDLLQFLTQSGKSGTLRFTDGQRSKLLSFSQGQLEFAVGQHALPPLAELLAFRGIDASQLEALRFESQVGARERMRALQAGLADQHPTATLGKILVQQGRLRQEDLSLLLEPENLPERFLERLLIEHAGLSMARILEVQQGSAPETGLVQGLVESGTLDREGIVAAVQCMDEASLAELLVFHGVVKRSEAQFTVGQLRQLRDHARPSLRLGDFLLALGLVTPRQLEKALGEQQSWHRLLGEILCAQGVLDEATMEQAQALMASLRFEFSPWYPLYSRLEAACGLGLEEFTRLQEQAARDNLSLADLLVTQEKIEEEPLQALFREVLTHEICDVMLWTEGTYEFFEGFTLEDALQIPGLGRIHGGRFELGSVLLDAHYRVDELTRENLGELREDSILVAADANQTQDAFVDDDDRRLLRRCDGRRDLLRVCVVMPGNSLTHRERMQDFVSRGLLRRLSRHEAWLAAQASMAADEFEQAVTFCQHALQMPGPEPTDLRLRTVLQDARLSKERGLLGGVWLGLRRGARLLLEVPGVRPLQAWLRQRRSLCRLQHGLVQIGRRCRGMLAQRSLRFSNRLDGLLLRTGLNRHWWALHNGLLAPLFRWMRRPAVRLGTVGASCAAVVFVLMLPGVPTLEVPDQEWKWDPSKGGSNYPPGWQPRMVRRASTVVEVGGPVQRAPLVHGDQLYFSSRDGQIYCYGPGGTGLKRVWAAELGSFGDILSAPVAFGDQILVSNVNGAVRALGPQGQSVWNIRLPRTENLPAVVLGEIGGKGPAALALCVRESVRILDPDGGTERFRLDTGNRLLCAPVVQGSRLFVGSSDNHVYCMDWTNGEVVWEKAVGEDVRMMLRREGMLVLVVRGEQLVSLDAENGALRWRVELGKDGSQQLEAVGNDRVYVGAPGGRLRVFDLESGTPLSRFTPHPSLQVRSLQPVGDHYVYVSGHGYVGQLDGAGAHRWRSLEPVGTIADFKVYRDRLLVVTEEGQLRVFVLDTGKLRDPAPRNASLQVGYSGGTPR